MTVRELKALLEKYDDDLEVVYQEGIYQHEINDACLGYSNFDDGDYYLPESQLSKLDSEDYEKHCFKGLVLTSETIDDRKETTCQE